MGIVGAYPESGVRVEVVRSEAGPPWEYLGHAVVPTARFALRVEVSERGEVAAQLAAGAPAGLTEMVRLLMRVACKRASGDGTPPPRRILRWRAAR